MSRTLLWLVASLAFASLTSLADGAPLKVMSAPNLLRVGTAENIFVECQDCNGGDIRVEVRVMNHPTKTNLLASTSVTLTSAKNFQELAQIKIPAGDFSKDPNMKQYVYLQAQFPDRLLEKVVLVSFQSGYIFIQTDKTLYTPNSRVYYRMFAVTPGMEPVEKDDETQTDASIVTEIVTPEGIVLTRNIVSLTSGIHSGDYQLPEIVSVGLWKVVVKFQSNPQQSFSAEFEVKEYVLPSFEVKLTPESPFFYVDSQELTVNIKATYLFGEEVAGTAYVVFGVMYGGQKKSFQGSLVRVPIESGNGVATLKKEHITQTFPNILDLVNVCIYVRVSVLTASGGEMVEAELDDIKIVTSPYTIHFKKSPKYFKQGMSYDVAVEVVNPDDTPAQGVVVVVDPGQVQALTAANGMARLTINTEARTNYMTITAKTSDPRISHERQASANMTALPYTTKGNNYIHIGVDTAELQIGDNLKINLNLNRQENQYNDITYLVLSRGQLVKHGRFRRQGEVLISLIEPITKEMLPSFRIIAYYHTNDNEVVSDSVWIDVEDSCMGSLKLESSRHTSSFEPRRMFGLKVTGDPGATVGLVAVDKGVYVLNNKHRLTQKKVWNVVEKYDTGCTPGGGKDSMGVFYDAGLLFESSTASGTPYRLELKCPAPSRSKRTTTIMDVTTSLVSKYEDQLQRDCCLDGMRGTTVSYNCERRSEYIVDGPACVQAFVDCCQKMESQRAERMHDSLILGRSEEDDSYMDSNEIVSRTKFPESWLWSDIKLPTCSNCDTTSSVKTVPLPDSITTWQFTGISLSSTHGICVGEPLEVIVRKDFFIDLRLPYTAVRGEQLEIRAILHNYSPDPATVRVDLIEQENVCSAAFKRRRYRQDVEVEPLSTRSVPFIIIPLKEGQFPIEVKASVKDSSLNDGVKKMLLVVPEGVLVKSFQTVTLDPTNNGVGGTQEEVINSGIPKKDLVPDSPTSTEISVTGREQVSVLVENAISGNSMGSLIYQPSGCGEQNMARMTLPVIAAAYLDKTNQWETVGFQKRIEALKHITTGYQNELAYRKNDGSFAVWSNSQSSTWLTAYVAKVFAMASHLVAVQSKVICDAVKFLTLNTQQPDGSFREVGKVYHGEMIGDVRGANSDASMTAFCLIAMQESRTLCDTTVNHLPGSIDKAVAYLERHLPSLTNPYAVTMTSYALANENILSQEILYKFVSPGALSHWPVPKGRVYTLEATAYALLALVKAKEFDKARPVVRWFNKQQKVGGGYGSTQATIMVYQAVAEYWASAKEPEYDLNVDILLPGRSKPDKFNFNRENHYVTRTSKMNEINQNVTVIATGTGEAKVTMVSLYYTLPKEKDTNCQKFDLSVQLLPEKLDGDEKIYKLKIEVLFKDMEHDATMSILDIGLLSGFIVNTDDLNLLSKGRARIISKYEMNTVLSEKGSLIIYLDKVSHTQPEEITFRIHQKLKGDFLQPAAVSVYEYYEQTHCVKFYRPERRAGQLLQLCINDACTCAEENCSMQKKGNIQNADRTAKACESDQTGKIDFVYKVRLDQFREDLSTDIYTMQVLEVIKEGSYDVGSQGKQRTFLSYPHCRESLDLGTGKTYLIMGSSQDIQRDYQKQLYQYVLGERTWIEYWPTGAECQIEEYRPTCLGMEDLSSRCQHSFPSSQADSTLQSDDSTPPPPVTSTVCFNADHVRRQLMRLHSSKVVGPDGVNPKPVPPSYVEYFNMSLSLQSVPVLRKTSCLVPVPKTPCPQWLQGLQTRGTDLPHHEDHGETHPGAAPAHVQATLGPLSVPYQPQLGVEDAIIFLLNHVSEHCESCFLTSPVRSTPSVRPYWYPAGTPSTGFRRSVATAPGSPHYCSNARIFPQKVMSAPNLLRVGTAENIFVECQDCNGGDIRVEVRVMNHPTKTNLLASTSVTLTSAKNFQELAQIKIPTGDFSKDPNMKQYVYLQAQFPDRLLEKVVLVSFQSGYIFIQTDKTLYTPNSRVYYRMFAVTPRMEPVEKDDETQTDGLITTEIVTPEGIIFQLYQVSLKSGIHSGDYKLPEIASVGLWKVVAKFHSNPQQSFSAEFEVKEYVLPSFEVKLTPESPFFYVDSQELTVNIKATYLFGEEVWDIVEKYDTGCTPGGGEDSMGVFYDAGLLFESSASGTPYRLGEEDDSYMDSNEIVSRTKFPESWLWSDIKLPTCSNCDTTSLVQNVPLPDSITTWQFIGISLSSTHGICVADPLEVIVRKDFFIDLRLPHSAVRGEQLEIKAILHNYSPDPATVRVDLIEEAHLCSSASKRRKYRQEVQVEPQTIQSVPFIMIPMKEGQFPIEVKAAVKDSSLSDGIRKMLWVVPEGVLIKSTKIITLDPATGGIDGKQNVIINSEIPLKDLAPNTPASTEIYLTGREQMSALVENAVGGKSLGTLIKQPSGSGEDNMITMTLSVIAAMYLDKTNQWETVGFEKRDEALQHIMTGYNNELSYRKIDGSFAAWATRQSSTWLTAYVAKVFAMASHLVAVQSKVICDAVKFLTLNTQQPDGSFREVGTIIHGEMIGDVLGTDSDASMTAFCLIAMQESRTLCVNTVNATKMVYQALAEYWANAGEPEYDLDVDVFLPGRSRPDRFHFNRENHHATKTSRFNSINKDVNVTATGKGEVTLKMVSLYYALPKEKESDCQKFNLSVQLLPEKMDEDENIYKLKIEVLYKDMERDATMSILNIGLLTGFTVNTDDLDLLSKGRARTIAKYEMNTVLSERGSLIIYLDKVSHTQPEEITFRIHQKLKGDLLQPAAVSVYEYYDQTQCVKFYHPERRAGQLLLLCINDACICAEENCSMQRKGKIRIDERTEKSCESSRTSKIDFVYKVRMEAFTGELSADVHTARIVEVIKEGSYDVGPLGKLRTFLSYAHCREALDLRTGKTYLIMGASTDIHKDQLSQSYQYVLSERTWIEYWPTEEECLTVEHRHTCLGIEEMVVQQEVLGCPQ
ncbi:complement C3-like [Enoplosus armatus]|uniref:complement C3-like n=1 Tax=Enoplosus armatus TaxID=215367 RepID=UPI0039921DB8